MDTVAVGRSKGRSKRDKPEVVRSKRIAKYISLTSFILAATYSTLTGLPAGPVCLVTKVSPSICSRLGGRTQRQAVVSSDMKGYRSLATFLLTYLLLMTYCRIPTFGTVYAQCLVPISCTNLVIWFGFGFRVPPEYFCPSKHPYMTGTSRFPVRI